jgi:hypothetical protein
VDSVHRLHLISIDGRPICRSEVVYHLDKTLPDGSLHDNPQLLGEEPVTDTGPLQDSGEDAGQSIRRSNRETRQPSRFASTVMVGLQLGKFLFTEPITGSTGDKRCCNGTRLDIIKLPIKTRGHKT